MYGKITHFRLQHVIKKEGGLPPQAALSFFVLCLSLSHSQMHIHFVSLLISVRKVVNGCLFVTFTAWLFRLKASSNPALSPRYWWISSLNTALNCQRRKNATAEKGFTLISDKFWLQRCQSPVSCVNSVYLYKGLFGIYIFLCFFSSCSRGFTKASDLLQALKKIEEKDTAGVRKSDNDRKRGIPVRLYKRCLRLEREADVMAQLTWLYKLLCAATMNLISFTFHAAISVSLWRWNMAVCWK